MSNSGPDTGPIVIFSDKAFSGIVAETFDRSNTETGGIFLGTYLNGVWYVLETLDPGPNSIFQTAYFEYDTPYVNHLADKVSRFYRQSISLVGLWHRHPGGLDRFSATDDSTNAEYARRCKNGAVSAIVNLDPNFRITIYIVKEPLQYQRVDYRIGDDLIPGGLLELKRWDDFLSTSHPKVLVASEVERLSSTIASSRRMTQARPNRLEKVKVSQLISSVGRKITDRLANARRDEEDEDSLPASASTSALVEILEPELDYLARQIDYDASIELVTDQMLVVKMECKNAMEEYPRLLEFIFVNNATGSVRVTVGGKTYPYRPEFIRRYLDHYIQRQQNEH